MQLIWVSLSLALSASAHPSPPSRTWSGWKGVKNFFVFGDSYTTTGFNPNGTQPNAANPLGNPAYPGYTSSNGPNWVDFLTTTYNKSSIRTYNLAYGGATVDSALVAPYLPTVLSLKQQIQDEFLPTYASASSAVKYTSSDSLFAFFIGINDVGNTWYKSNVSTIFDQIFTEYAGLLDQVYKAGARNYLYLNVPPVNLSPGTLVNGNYSIDNEGLQIQNWNDRVKNLVTSFEKSHKGVQTFLFDTNAVFSKVLKNVKSYPQTAGYKNTTGYCTDYQNGTPSWYTKSSNCTYAVNEYFWLNTLHPTFPMHNATAAQIVKFLK